MNKKNIENNIDAKVSDWISSITDTALSERIKDCIIVTGGCIASMLLSEKVNDYDIYFSDKSVLLDLTEYYIDQVHAAIGEQKDKDEVSQAKKDSFGYFNVQVITNENQCAKKQKFSSITEIAESTTRKDQIKLMIAMGNYPVPADLFKDVRFAPVFFSPNAITLSNKIQIILRFIGEAHDIHKNFDFSHVLNYFTYKEGLVLNSTALESLLSKELRYRGSLYPLTSIIRMRKFLARGWHINAGEILKILFQVSELDLTDVKVLEEQLVGVDVTLFCDFIKVLKNEEAPGNVDYYDYISKLIDNLFQSPEFNTEQYD